MHLPGNGAATTLQICNLSKEDLAPSRDAKFSSGIHVSCPHLGCSMKNSQFQQTGRFPAGSIISHVIRLMKIYSSNGVELTFSEFLLNHLHSNHKHRRFNGDSLDLTMVVPQLEYEIAKWSGLLCI